jgi:hypothetical protein
VLFWLTICVTLADILLGHKSYYPTLGSKVYLLLRRILVLSALCLDSVKGVGRDTLRLLLMI